MAGIEEDGISLDVTAEGEEGQVARRMIALPAHEGLKMAIEMLGGSGVSGSTRMRVTVSLHGKTPDGREQGHKVIFSPESTL